MGKVLIEVLTDPIYPEHPPLSDEARDLFIPLAARDRREVEWPPTRCADDRLLDALRRGPTRDIQVLADP